MKNINVLESGFHSTYQDNGRIGYQNLGIPKSGAMDIWNMYISNILVGKDKNSTVLEITYTGPKLEFLSDMTIAVTGADMQPRINGYQVNNYQSIFIKTGDVLTFDGLREGLRSYIAFSGKIICDEYFNSSSTYEKYAFGRKLKSGDLIMTDDNETSVNLSIKPIFDYDNVIRILKSFEYDENIINEFIGIQYKISNNSDRMGIKLEGDSLKSMQSSDIISSPIVPGTIQVPKNGIPIIMMKDAQTIGGYTRIASVIPSDLPKLSQLKSGDPVVFKIITLEEAKSIRLSLDNKIDELEKLMTNKDQRTFRVLVNKKLYHIKIEERK